MNNRFTPCRAADWPWREEASEAVLMFHSKSWEPGRRGIREFKPQISTAFYFTRSCSLEEHPYFSPTLHFLSGWSCCLYEMFLSRVNLTAVFPLLFFLPLSASSPQPCWQYLLWHTLYRRWRDKETVQSLHPLLLNFLKSSLLIQGWWKPLFIFSPSKADQKAEKLSALKCYPKDMRANWMW